MGLCAHWTKVRRIAFVIFALYAASVCAPALAQQLYTSRSPASTPPGKGIARKLPPKIVRPAVAESATADEGDDDSPLKKPTKEPPPGEIQKFLRIVDAKRKKCLTKRKPVGVCQEVKVLYQLEVLGKAYLSARARGESLKSQMAQLNNKVNYANLENSQLRTELKAIRSPASYEEYRGCYKKDFVKELLMNYGVDINGSNMFSKIPVGAGQCWSNSKKKYEATITICEYPLAVFTKTKGGVDDSVLREKQYLFSLNGCDLVAAQIHDTYSTGGQKETYLTYDECRTQWNKRTADAGMSATQVRLMEDTIGACFREHLLPPRNQDGGRKNPLIPAPPGVNQSRSPAGN